ncbi:hypothetical protein LBMAG52_15350 [Planctomycetia bacterium]|nr:hypothetical protein LBMAG52_15350 [Planctomycetia bacterium]
MADGTEAPEVGGSVIGEAILVGFGDVAGDRRVVVLSARLDHASVIVKIPQKTGKVLMEFRATNRIPAGSVLSPFRGAGFQPAIELRSDEK